jgi:hypothetical protein
MASWPQLLAQAGQRPCFFQCGRPGGITIASDDVSGPGGITIAGDDVSGTKIYERKLGP